MKKINDLIGAIMLENIHLIGSSSLSVAVNPTQEAAGPGDVLAPLGHTSFV